MELLEFTASYIKLRKITSKYDKKRFQHVLMHPFHFSLHSWARDPGLGSKAAAGRAQAGPLVAAALWPGPGSWPQECKEKWK